MIARTKAVWLAMGVFLAPFALCLGAYAQGNANEITFTQRATGSGAAGANGDYYVVEKPIRLRLDISAASGTPSVTFVDTILPAGWTFTGVAGEQAPDIVPLSQGPNLTFGWLDAPTLPFSFFIEFLVPSSETRTQTINSRVRFVDSAGSRAATAYLPLTLRRDTTPPFITLIGGGVTLNCQEPFFDPGVTADDNADGDLTTQVRVTGFVNSSVPGRYVITYDVTDSTGNAAVQVRRQVAVLANCPEQQPAGCNNNCAGDSGDDLDNDGLTDCQETCIYGTELDDSDSDGDGMDDEYEVTFLPTLNPLDPSDRTEDPDGDGFTNLEEFLRGGSPNDAGSPQRAFFVSPTGANGALRGTRNEPFRTIQFALNTARNLATAQQRASIILLPGLYDTDITVLPFVTLSGDPGAEVKGTVTLLRDARVERLSIVGDDQDDILLLMRDDAANARVRNVVLHDASIGIRCEGAGPADADIDSCTFENLEIGLEIYGGAPKLRRSIFRNIASNSKGFTSAAVILRPLPDKQDENFDDEGNLGDTTDPAAGFNTFALSTIEGVAIINDRPGTVKIEENDWNTDDEEEIAAVLDGSVDFVPFLKSGSAVFASSLFATVTNAVTKERITDATVTLAPGTFGAQTENEQGVYTFPAIAEGAYNVRAEAPGFDPVTANVTIGASQLANVLIALGAPAPPDENGGCNNGGEKTGASTVPSAEAALLGAAMTAILMLATVVVRRRARQ